MGHLRAKTLAEKNWLAQQLNLVKCMDMEEATTLRFRNEDKHAKLKP